MLRKKANEVSLAYTRPGRRGVWRVNINIVSLKPADARSAAKIASHFRSQRDLEQLKSRAVEVFFQERMQKYENRIEFAAKTLAKEFKKHVFHKAHDTRSWRRLLQPFYIVSSGRRLKTVPRLFNMAWEEVVRRASKKAGTPLRLTVSGTKIKSIRRSK